MCCGYDNISIHTCYEILKEEMFQVFIEHYNGLFDKVWWFCKTVRKSASVVLAFCFLPPFRSHHVEARE